MSDEWRGVEEGWRRRGPSLVSTLKGGKDWGLQPQYTFRCVYVVFHCCSYDVKTGEWVCDITNIPNIHIYTSLMSWCIIPQTDRHHIILTFTDTLILYLCVCFSIVVLMMLRLVSVYVGLCGWWVCGCGALLVVGVGMCALALVS